MRKVVVITGSYRGIGYAMLKEFLKAGCQVVISGRNASYLQDKTLALTQEFDAENVHSMLCDVSEFAQVEALWQSTVEKFGKVDIWINNAASSHEQVNVWEVTPEKAHSIVNGNILGAVYGSQVAMKEMMAQGYGAIYNFSGFGSDGRTRFGTGIYGATKSATTYFTKAMAEEAKDTGIVVGDLSPGMVLTDLVIGKIPPEQLERVKPIFNIVADLPKNVAPWLVEKMLTNTENGVRLVYSPRWKTMLRFLTAPFNKRDLFQDLEME